MELCTRNFFLLDKLWINNFIWRCWKDYAIVYRKNDQKCGAAVTGCFTMTMPLPIRPWVCSSFWQKATWRLSLILPIHPVIPHPPYSPGYPSSSLFTQLSLILPIHPTLHHATFSCSLIWKARQKGNILPRSVNWKRKRQRSWTTSTWKSSRNVFSSGKNVGTSALSQKESTLKETGVVIV